MPPDSPEDLELPLPVAVASAFSPQRSKGYVRLKVGSVEITMRPAAARRIAADLLESASNAVADEFLVTYLIEAVDMEPLIAATALTDARARTPTPHRTEGQDA